MVALWDDYFFPSPLALREENKRLRALVAEQMLEIEQLKSERELPKVQPQNNLLGRNDETIRITNSISSS